LLRLEGPKFRTKKTSPHIRWSGLNKKMAGLFDIPPAHPATIKII